MFVTILRKFFESKALILLLALVIVVPGCEIDSLNEADSQMNSASYIDSSAVMSFKVLTYNTHIFKDSNAEIAAWFVDQNIIYDDDNRKELIAQRILASGADIVALEEVWALDNLAWFASRLSSVYPHSYYPPETNTHIFDPDYYLDKLKNEPGLLLLSKWEMKDKQFVRYNDLNGDDDYSKKGVTTANVKLPDVNSYVRVSITHCGTDVGGDHLPNITQLVNATNSDNRYPSIMTGDFNAHSNDYAVMQSIFDTMNAHDAYLELHNPIGVDDFTVYKYINELNQYFSSGTGTEGDGDRLDYIYYNNQELGYQIAPVDAYVIRDWEYNSGMGYIDLSDHFPVMAEFTVSPWEQQINEPVQKIQVTAKRFVCEMADDEGPDNTVDMDRFSVSLKGFNINSSGTRYQVNSGDESLYYWSTSGEKDMDPGDVHTMNTSKILSFNTQDFDFNSALMELSAYARDYDGGGWWNSNEDASNSIQVTGANLLDGDGNYQIMLYSADFRFRCELAISFVD
ncbi:MAG: hypothetical protein GY754_28720 [bacterium]|nr:hypothetical protein [bacterium]